MGKRAVLNGSWEASLVRPGADTVEQRLAEIVLRRFAGERGFFLDVSRVSNAPLGGDELKLIEETCRKVEKKCGNPFAGRIPKSLKKKTARF